VSRAGEPADIVPDMLPANAVSDVPVIAVSSGKGGTGKTSVAVALARELVTGGRRVGLLDADLYGPDVPRMLGLRRDAPASSVQLAAAPGTRHATIEAMEVDGLKVASVGFLLGREQGFAAAAPFAEMLLARLIRQTAWGELDVLVVDLPPGTGDIQSALLRLSEQVAVLLVTTPAEVSHMDTARAVAVLRQAGTEILGGVENMAYLTCPSCGAEHALHEATPGDRTIWAQDVPRLALLPFRPAVGITAADIRPVAAAVAAYLDG
jgi:ATP-binding protein involved in chromosome partitioning